MRLLGFVVNVFAMYVLAELDPTIFGVGSVVMGIVSFAYFRGVMDERNITLVDLIKKYMDGDRLC